MLRICVNSPTMRVVEAPTPARQSPSSANRQNKIYKFCPVSAFTLSTPAHLFLAGVQTMRARICSAFSCDMFARVVCLRLRRAAKLPTCVLSFVALTRHAWLARLTRARGNEPMHAVRWLASPRQGRRFLRGWKILLNDFCR